MLPVCQPLAMRPPHIVRWAAASSAWNGCGSNSRAKARMAYFVTARLPSSMTSPALMSSQ